MDADELAKRIIERGYELKSIRVFTKSFHVNVWSKDYKTMRYYKVPIESLEWKDIQHEYPKEA